MALATLALDRANFANAFELPLETRDSFLDAAAVDFELRFTRAPRADAASLPRKVAPHPSQTRQQILQLRQLDLEAAFAAPGALREDVENELGAIEHFPRQQIFQVASLGRRKFVVENNRRDVLVLERFLDQFRLSFADVIGRGRLLKFLRDGVDYLGAGGIRQLGQFFHRIAQVPFRDAFLLETNQERALLLIFRTNFNHPRMRTRAALCEMSSTALAGSCAERFSDEKLVWRRNQVNCLLA